MSLKGFSSWACPSTSQMFNPSRMFSWYQSFTISAPWKKGKKVPQADSKVVLTNVKIINNEKKENEELGTDPPESSKGTGITESNVSQQASSLTILSEASVTSEDVVASPGLKHLVPRLVKIESEDSGVELPSRANSPSTPRGSEKSFVLHSRDSSCDSGVLSASSSPAADHVIKRMCEDTVDHSLCLSDDKKLTGYCAGQTSAVSVEDNLDCPGRKSPEVPFFDGNQEECLEDKTSEGGNIAITLATSVVDKMPRDDYGKDSLDELVLEGHPLRKYPTSDSLDEYMDECCRLSKVNQGNAKALGSGLGYLEHICQLIEKIGQLQEHNLRLQKQVCSLQKEQRTIQLNEEYFVQHCCCGAASIFLSSHQELKNIFPGKSRPQSLLIQNGNLSDLSIIPEAGGSSEKSSKERDAQLDLENNWLIMKLKLSNGRKSEVNECREGCSLTEGQDCLLKEGESQAWGRMKDLVKKSRGRNQSRLGLVSASLKRSCPQLYRPDAVSLDMRKVERNSMIALGQSSRNESSWPF